MTRRRAFGSVERRKRKDGSWKPGFYAKFTHQGRRYVRTGGPTEAHARKKLSAAQGLLAAGVPIERVLSEVFGDFDGAKLTFKAAAPLYLEYPEPRKRPNMFRGDVTRFRMLCRASRAREFLSRLSSDRIARHVQHRMAHGRSAATINRELSAISSLFRWAILMGYCDDSPVKRVDRPSERDTGREIYLYGSECRALLGAAEGVIRDIVTFALGTGCRCGEILSLSWRAVELGESAEVSSVRIGPENSKSGKGRTIPLTADVFAMLRARLRARPRPHVHGDDPVFWTVTGDRVPYHTLRSGFARVKEVAKRLAARDGQTAFAAKLDRLRFHDTRHTAASLMVRAGVPVFDVSKILGHSTLQMTMRYAHFAPEAGRAAMSALGEALAKGA